MGLVVLVVGATCALAAQAPPWSVHSMERPRPPVIMPGPGSLSTAPPSDAVILFDGHHLEEWHDGRGGTPGWRVEGGAVVVVPGTGNLVTRRVFGDLQVHLEWATPTPPQGEGQGRGNSGVFLMGYYEIQILDSWENDTYPDGQAGALYGQHPPTVNASRPPGQWQTYDIVFRRPRFRADGSVERPARVTVLHNGVVIHDAVEFEGRTVHLRRASYAPHPERLPLVLQNHGDPVRFRNIWVRELAEERP